ncbi:histidyl-tRNA synthetase [Linnemannia elongata]|nr:histidyl-tRNA synthetase [Linnemannia elongata]
MAALVTRIRVHSTKSLCRCFSSKANNEQTNPVRGMKDRFGDENRRFQWINDKGAKIASLYGFDQVTTPILEYSQVFERTLGDSSDVVGKELYSFEDKGGSRLTMRPEGTAGITRALISQKLYNDLPQKFYYSGPMFRHERPQKGRLRQFEQFGIEVYGQSHASSDVETIELASVFLKSLGLNSASLEINTLGDNASRHSYKAALTEYLSKFTEKLSEDSVNRLSTNPLRILDSKSPQDMAILENSPVLSDYLSDASKERFAFITRTLEHMEIPFTINPRLVRGLDYYQDTVFEFKVTSPLLGAQQGTVLAGGRYDGLVEKMGGPVGLSSIGWAAGLERLSLLVEDNKIPLSVRPIAIIPVPDRNGGGGSDFSAESKVDKNTPSVMALHSHAMSVSAALREKGLRVEFMHLTGSSSSKSQLPKQLARASKMNASHAVLIGTDEMQKGIVTLKDLDKAEQQRCTFDELARALSAQ